MRTYAIIPARHASTRLPGKPLLMIGGKPMIQRVYERARDCSAVKDVVVATDDVRILEAVLSFGGRCVLTRTDHASGTDRLDEAADLLGLADDDLVVNIQGDEPLFDPAMIDLLVEAAVSSGLEMSTLAYPRMDREEFSDPNCVKVVTDLKGRALYFSRSPIPCPRDGSGEKGRYLKHLGFYAYWRWFLRKFTALPPGDLEMIEKLEQLRALENGYSIAVAISPADSLSVDTPEDLTRVRQFLSQG